MIKFVSNYLNILKNGLEDWLYIFSFSNVFLYEIYLVYTLDVLIFMFITIIML
jgi:hypothetical protein